MDTNTPKGVILEALNITKMFDNLTVLENINFCLNQGEIVSLIGPNGCGKTTLLKILTRLIVSFSGKVKYQLEDKSKLPCAVVFQDSVFFPWLNILDNLKICINFGSLTNKEKHQLALNYLAKVNLLGFEGYLPGELSGGMIQRANIARAFLSSSEIILMDEPFIHLDFLQRISLQKMTLNILENELKTIFFITHNIHEAITLADRVLVMSSKPGKIIREFVVNIPRPRDVDAIREDKQYLSLVREIRGLLSEETKKNQIQFEAWIKEKHPSF